MNPETSKKPSTPKTKDQAQKISKNIEAVKAQVLEQIPVATIEFQYRPEIPPKKRLKISNSQEGANIFRKLWNLGTLELQEHFGVLLLNNANKVMGFYPLSTGGITSTLVDVRLILIAALQVGAVGIIACHNHPSGTEKPSVSDRELTEKIRKAAELLDLQFLDHIILTKERYFSFADAGEL